MLASGTHVSVAAQELASPNFWPTPLKEIIQVICQQSSQPTVSDMMFTCYALLKSALGYWPMHLPDKRLHVPFVQAAFTFTLDEDDLLEIDAAYEGATKQPTSDVFSWERGGDW